MKKIQKEWDFMSHEKRDSLVRQIITYFSQERGEEIGMLAAEDILDFFLEALYKDIYNKGVENAKILIKQNFENLDIDLDLLLNK